MTANDDIRVESRLWVILAALLGAIAGWALATVLLGLLVWLLKILVVATFVIGGAVASVGLFRDWMDHD